MSSAERGGGRVGASEDPKVRDAVDVLNALARASRSYLLYDPRNDAVRDQLQRLRERFAPRKG